MTSTSRERGKRSLASNELKFKFLVIKILFQGYTSMDEGPVSIPDVLKRMKVKKVKKVGKPSKHHSSWYSESSSVVSRMSKRSSDSRRSHWLEKVQGVL